MIPENRMSTEVVEAPFIPPDERARGLNEDFEAGPVALNDPSEGLSYQVWHLTWDPNTDNFIATPETVGSPQIVLNVADINQCSLAFDQNAHINIAYTLTNGEAYLYWYDTVAGMHVQTMLAAGVHTPTLCLDDKRMTQTQASDVQLWYTKQQPNDTWNLYMLEQRERYMDEQLMAEDTNHTIRKLGMNFGFRNQLAIFGPGTTPTVDPPQPPDPDPPPDPPGPDPDPDPDPDPPVLPPPEPTDNDLVNPGYEDGDVGWTKGAAWEIVSDGNAHAGSWAARLTVFSSTIISSILQARRFPLDGVSVVSVNCRIKTNTGNQLSGRAHIRWYGADGIEIGNAYGNVITSSSYSQSSVTANPPGAAEFVSVGCQATHVHQATSQKRLWVDSFSWNL